MCGGVHQREEMRTVMTHVMEHNAIGLSGGLIYPAAMWMTTQDFIELYHVVANYGRVFTCHGITKLLTLGAEFICDGLRSRINGAA
jgi:N-acyl-D-aspartate/D-glutamate deacylase